MYRLKAYTNFENISSIMYTFNLDFRYGDVIYCQPQICPVFCVDCKECERKYKKNVDQDSDDDI